MRHRRAFIFLAMAFSVVTAARSGHESPVYPSYYPHEIELAAVAPERAAELLLAGKIQAYVGGAPRFASAPPDSIGSVESLGSFVVVRVNPSSPLARDGRSGCAVAEIVVRDLAGKSGDLIVHPYPVTPFHGDYLNHADLAEAAKARVLDSRADSPGSGIQNLKVKTAGDFARSLVRPEWRTQSSDWDVEVAEIDAAEFVASASYSMNGWLGPAWLRTGWFHASLLLGEQAGEEDLKQLKRLQLIDYADAVERINLERSLVSALAGGCSVRVAGYTVKREYYSTVFTAGVENIAYDSVTGFNSPMFIRTVKLKDFPWNGWLALGIDAAPTAAWNPVAGFTDNFGRLMWSAVGDPALIPSPNESAWMLNRISDVQSSARR
ncbi:MAG: hypothetical protein WD207_10200 [Xanthobacteraceae bacterium]